MRVDLRVQLSATAAFSGDPLHPAVVDQQGPLTPASLSARLRDRFVEQFRYLHTNSTGKLRRFLDFITYAYQIDNVVLLVSGTLHGYEKDELLERCHPLGWFDALPAIIVSPTPDDIYHTVLAESPLGPYFKHCLSADDLDELHVELIRGSLTRAYLEHFHSWVMDECNEGTRETMRDLLALEADRRALSITLATLGGGDGLVGDARLRLMARFGRLWETGAARRLALAESMEQIRAVLVTNPEYRLLFPEDVDSKSPSKDIAADYDAGSDERSLDEQLAEREVAMCKMSFGFPFTFTPFYAWTRLKEQELRNVRWIAECIAQKQKQHIAHYIATN